MRWLWLEAMQVVVRVCCQHDGNSQAYFMPLRILCMHISSINDIELLRRDQQEAGYRMFVIEAK
jgi:hypothetical protein